MIYVHYFDLSGFILIQFFSFVFLFQMGRKQRTENLDKAMDHMYRKTKDLRRQLRKAVVDHVSDRYYANIIILITFFYWLFFFHYYYYLLLF